MHTVTNTNTEYKPNNLWKKSSIRRDGTYRIFHITKKQKEDSDDDDDDDLHTKTQQINDKENELKTKYQKKSFKISNRNGLDAWKRKSTKNKRLLFLHRASCESTSNEGRTSSLSHHLVNDSSQSIISNDAPSNQLLKINKENNIDGSSESNALVETIDETAANDNATLNDLLARADKLETTVKNQEFNKIQLIPRTNFHQKRRKRVIISCSVGFIILAIIITIIIFVVVMTLRYKANKNPISKSSSIYDPHR